ncbi:MAG: hypothetical protein R3A48_15570 [Polyangiales bacterium]
MRPPRLVIALVTLAAFATPAWAQRRARFSDPALSLPLPPGFEPYAEQPAGPAVLGTYRRAPAAGRGPVVIQLLRLGGELPQRALTAEERGAFSLGAPFRFDDQPGGLPAFGHTLPTSAGRGRTPSGAGVFRIAALLPTRGNAVQLSVLTREEDAAEGRALLSSALRGAAGDITWQTPAQRALFALATLAFATATLGTLVMMVRALMQGRVTHLGPAAQRRISLVTGLCWGYFGVWLLAPLASAEWAAAVPTLALAVTFLDRARRGRQGP